MKVIKNYFIPIVAVIIVIIGFVKINIVNTESLSPLGNTDDNFKVVSAEFGEDFQEFIMDKSPVKIYIGEKDDGLSTVKVYNKEINLTNDNFFMNTIRKITGYVNKVFVNIKDKMFKDTKTNSENTKIYKDPKNENESEFDKNVDEFIKNINEQ
ncbi:hypothetical protein ABFP60_09000 [Clostridioides difficile]